MNDIWVRSELKGTILDIGGGGEGIIGRVYGQQVTAIDNRQEELDEAPDNGHKLLMDASALAFQDGFFDNVTFFYSLMYMSKETKKNAIKEAFRVLKHNGTLAIWDAVIENAAPDPFLIDLRIHINDLIVETTYGVGKEDAFQNSSTIIDLCENAGFKLKNALKDGASFNLIFIK